jgi:hypothetical protein
MTRVGKAHWLGAVFPKFCSPENIMIRLCDLRRLSGLCEIERGGKGWVVIENPLSKALCPFDQIGYPKEEVMLPQSFRAS